VQTSAEEAAKVIIEGVKKRQGRILIGQDALYLDALQRNHPPDYQDSEEYQKLMETIFPEEWGKSGS
jgi:hypothetical protein